MNFPKVIIQHKHESESFAIILYQLRELGIFRNITESDYGIDFEMEIVNLVNKIQIVKRQRGLSGDDVVELERMLTEEDMEDSLRVGVNLLLDRQNEAEAIFGTLPEEEKKRLREFLIWRYWRTAME